MGTTVRKLTDAETGALGPLLRELHAHVESCETCQVSRDAETAGDFGARGMCETGTALYRRWLEWLART